MWECIGRKTRLSYSRIWDLKVRMGDAKIFNFPAPQTRPKSSKVISINSAPMGIDYITIENGVITHSTYHIPDCKYAPWSFCLKWNQPSHILTELPGLETKLTMLGILSSQSSRYTSRDAWNYPRLTSSRIMSNEKVERKRHWLCRPRWINCVPNVVTRSRSWARNIQRRKTWFVTMYTMCLLSSLRGKSTHGMPRLPTRLNSYVKVGNPACDSSQKWILPIKLRWREAQLGKGSCRGHT